MDASDGYRHIRRDRNVPKPKTPETWADAYVSLREALGFETNSLRGSLRGLLAFMRARGIPSFAQLDRRTAAAWLNSGSPQELTVIGRLAAMRGFFRYLVGLGAARENVWSSFSAPKPKRFIPHIFSLAELRTVLNHTRRETRSKNRSFARVRATYYTMFHTVYACGLRAGEICRLNIGDVDLERSIFIVRETKFGKTRLVPFNSRTRELVGEYLDRLRLPDDGMPPEAPLFLNSWRKAYVSKKFGEHFSRMCVAAGVHRPKMMKGNTVYGSTNLHALRHTFAVHRLLKWYQEGADVNAKLPLLSTYMGHAHYSYTQKYLTVLPRFIDIAGKLFADKFEGSLRDLEWPSDP
jgi:integrase/recombinase XerD